MLKGVLYDARWCQSHEEDNTLVMVEEVEVVVVEVVEVVVWVMACSQVAFT